VNVVERSVRAVDAFQQRLRPAAFVFGVIKKFGDDRGGSLCALLAFYGFVSLFPLLLLLVTILGFVGAGDHSFVYRVEKSAFSEFPIVGTKLSTNIHALHDHSVAGLVVGIVGVAWGSQGALQTAQYAQAEIWNIPNVLRPSFWSRLGRTAVMIMMLGVFLLASTVLAGFVTIGHQGAPAAMGAVIGSLALNVGLFLVAFRVLTPRQIAWRDMVPGAIGGAAGWTALQFLGGVFIEHSLRNTSKEYGAFALVLGLIAFLFLAAEVTLYAAETNVVLTRHLWPRTLVQPPLTAADKQVLSSIALEAKRRPEQYVATGFREGEEDTEAARPRASTQ
jgi:uncharacterized BrkB/YihY/UPF0761 family membrane protein